LDVVSYRGDVIAHAISISSNINEVKRTAEIFEMISLGVIDAVFNPNKKLWAVSFGGFVSEGTSLPYAAQNWQHTGRKEEAA
jgi:hypothetical protein